MSKRKKHGHIYNSVRQRNENTKSGHIEKRERKNRQTQKRSARKPINYNRETGVIVVLPIYYSISFIFFYLFILVCV